MSRLLSYVGIENAVMMARIFGAVAIGALIGLERSFHGRPAGFRTHALVCVASALLIYSLFVAAFVMPGAKIGKIAGERRVFQIGVVAHGISMLLMAVASDVQTMNIAQAIAGFAAALLVPTLVVLIAAHYHGRQQETALGVLASIPALASGLAQEVGPKAVNFFGEQTKEFPVKFRVRKRLRTEPGERSNEPIGHLPEKPTD